MNAQKRTETARLQQPQDPRPSGVLIDLARREVHLDGESLNLTFKEFELLNYLVENGTRTVGRDELLEGLWRNAEEVPTSAPSTSTSAVSAPSWAASPIQSVPSAARATASTSTPK
ncbi:transcriptional regulatory protein GlnR [Arthrobacter sp. Hiyo4]|nr:transcriptional regulatory protein GlnR [Arthrobacter sp. Hiyo4]